LNLRVGKPDSSSACGDGATESARCMLCRGPRGRDVWNRMIAPVRRPKATEREDHRHGSLRGAATLAEMEAWSRRW
jgi:hypothetical protein